MRADIDQQDLLFAYATGALPEAQALIVATQAAIREDTRRDISVYETIGGVLLDEADSEPLAPDSKAALFARLDEVEEAAAPLSDAPSTTNARVPSTLRPYINSAIEALPWRRRLPGIRDYCLPEMNGGVARLIWVDGKTNLPRHSHTGLEYTLVLEGAFVDQDRRFSMGELQIANGDLDHSPRVVDDAACICLVVTEAPLRLTGPLGRLFNRFVSY